MQLEVCYISTDGTGTVLIPTAIGSHERSDSTILEFPGANSAVRETF